MEPAPESETVDSAISFPAETIEPVDKMGEAEQDTFVPDDEIAPTADIGAADSGIDEMASGNMR